MKVCCIPQNEEEIKVSTMVDPQGMQQALTATEISTDLLQRFVLDYYRKVFGGGFYQSITHMMIYRLVLALSGNIC